MAKRINVVVSQGQSASPAKRALEEEIVTAMLLEPGVEIVVIPHLYDLQADGTGVLALQGLSSAPVVVLSWLYERAARWTLDRFGVRGRVGRTTIRSAEDEDGENEAAESDAGTDATDEKARVIDARSLPDRPIYCLDLRVHSAAQPYLDEIRRIRDEQQVEIVELKSWISGTPRPEQMQRYLNPLPIIPLKTAFAESGGTSGPAGGQESAGAARSGVVRIEEVPDRRWYPVIDYSRCTNCMECIDFCLFGVYGVDRAETILVEQPDNCRKGCPACSRVCPENAIIFPQHKTPAIAGADVQEAGGLKIDLSRLFGAPDGAEDAMAVAARERDEQLMLAGRTAVGMSVGIPKRQADKVSQPKDELDSLLDQLDGLDL